MRNSVIRGTARDLLVSLPIEKRADRFAWNGESEGGLSRALSTV